MKSMNLFVRSCRYYLYSHICAKRLISKRNQFLYIGYVANFKYCQESINKPSQPHSYNGAVSDSEGHESKQGTEDAGEQEEFRRKKEEEILESRILNAALSYVAVHGWSTDAIAKGAESLGYSSMIHGLFPKGEIDLVNYFYSQCNLKLEEELQVIAKERDEQKREIRTTQFIRDAVEMRLRMNIPYIDKWPQAIALHMSPSNATTALHNIGTLMDTIWYHAGDRSTDFNWYTKRLVLGTLYKSTELCMLQDSSDDFQDTWAFLDRRIDEIRAFAKCIRQAENAGKDIGSIGQAGLLTALNILGLNIKSRKSR